MHARAHTNKNTHQHKHAHTCKHTHFIIAFLSFNREEENKLTVSAMKESGCILTQKDPAWWCHCSSYLWHYYSKREKHIEHKMINSEFKNLFQPHTSHALNCNCLHIIFPWIETTESGQYIYVWLYSRVAVMQVLEARLRKDCAKQGQRVWSRASTICAY